MSQVLLPFPSQADFVVCFAPDRSWKILVQLQRNSMADEVVSVQCLSEVVTLYILQFTTDVHHATGDIRSTHADDRSEAGNGSEPAVNAHRSAVTSGCSGRSFRSSCHAASSASDNCFPLYFGCSKFARKWLSVTASVKHCITVVKCGFSASALRRLSHSSQASAIVALSDCSLSNAFATGCSYLFIYPF